MSPMIEAGSQSAKKFTITQTATAVQPRVVLPVELLMYKYQNPGATTHASRLCGTSTLR